MTNIVSSMNALESQINDKKKELSDLEDEIDQTQDNLEAAKQQSASQYEDMKIRIRYMYEMEIHRCLRCCYRHHPFLIF